MNLKEAIGRLFMIGLPGAELDEESKGVLDHIRPGTVILFARNIISKEQVRAYLDSVADFLGYRPLFAIDQEGGVVTRLYEGFTVAPSAMGTAATGEAASAYTVGSILGREMRAVGISWDLAPVVDVNNNPQNPGIGVRSYSSEPQEVIRYAGRFLQGLAEQGIISCLKHFPGKGRVAVDAHLDMPELPLGKEELRSCELLPFLQLEAPSWMPSHIYLPRLQQRKEPATLSREILHHLVRRELNYPGVLIADDLCMGGITNYYSLPQAVIRTLEAGMDVLSVCHHSREQMRAFDALVEAVSGRRDLQQRVAESNARLDRLFQLAGRTEGEGLQVVGCAEHRRQIREICAASIQILKGDPSFLPLKGLEVLISNRLSRLVMVEDENQGIPEITRRLERHYGLTARIYDPRIPETEVKSLIQGIEGKRVLLLTENAHLHPGARLLVQEAGRRSGELILLALRNPYDARIPGVSRALGSYGYTLPQQEALFHRLTGRRLSGRRPAEPPWDH